MTSIAFAKPDDDGLCAEILSILRAAGADATVNNLWVAGRLGGYDKLKMARRVLTDAYGIDIEVDRNAVLYTGDSTNDAPMFAFFRHTIGVSTVRKFLSQIPTPPNWITRGPGAPVSSRRRRRCSDHVHVRFENAQTRVAIVVLVPKTALAAELDSAIPVWSAGCRCVNKWAASRHASGPIEKHIEFV